MQAHTSPHTCNHRAFACNVLFARHIIQHRHIGVTNKNKHGWNVKRNPTLNTCQTRTHLWVWCVPVYMAQYWVKGAWVTHCGRWLPALPKVTQKKKVNKLRRHSNWMDLHQMFPRVGILCDGMSHTSLQMLFTLGVWTMTLTPDLLCILAGGGYLIFCRTRTIQTLYAYQMWKQWEVGKDLRRMLLIMLNIWRS